MTLIIFIIVLITFILGVNLFIWINPTFGAKSRHKDVDKLMASPNYKDGKFQNLEPTKMMTGDISRGKVIKKFIKGGENTRPDKAIETVEFNTESFSNSKNGLTYTWFGHSTVLMKINNNTIITDPVFSKAASPISFFNKSFDFTKNYTVDILPTIDVVLISHDHYDHLDYKTIKKIDLKTSKFIVPLGVEAHLIRWGINREKIEVADWGDTIKLNNDLIFVSTPARHFSGRSTRDRDKTLWCSWVIQSNGKTIYFGGDSGYGKHFKEIGEKYGPFDLTLLECGQYNENWNQIHTMPEHTVQANIDLKGKTMLPVHWSKFKLSIHSWTEPIQRVKASAGEKKVNLQNPKIGEIVELKK